MILTGTKLPGIFIVFFPFSFFFGASFLCNEFKLTYHLIQLSVNQFWCLSPFFFFPVYALPGFKDGKWKGRMHSTGRGMAFKSFRMHYVNLERTLWSSYMVGIKEKHTVKNTLCYWSQVSVEHIPMYKIGSPPLLKSLLPYFLHIF